MVAGGQRGKIGFGIFAPRQAQYSIFLRRPGPGLRLGKEEGRTKFKMPTISFHHSPIKSVVATLVALGATTLKAEEEGEGAEGGGAVTGAVAVVFVGVGEDVEGGVALPVGEDGGAVAGSFSTGASDVAVTAAVLPSTSSTSMVSASAASTTSEESSERGGAAVSSVVMVPGLGCSTNYLFSKGCFSRPGILVSTLSLGSRVIVVEE